MRRLSISCHTAHCSKTNRPCGVTRDGEVGIDIDWGLHNGRCIGVHIPTEERERVRGPGKIKKELFGKGGKHRGTAKNLYTKSERQTVSCRETWAWTERANLYSRHVMVLPRNVWNIVGPKALFQLPGASTILPCFRRHWKRFLPFPQGPDWPCTLLAISRAVFLNLCETAAR